jgi:lipopolysaccharide export LptBFGC system permease protein LptF
MPIGRFMNILTAPCGAESARKSAFFRMAFGVVLVLVVLVLVGLLSTLYGEPSLNCVWLVFP